jgi:hypothetical protein
VANPGLLAGIRRAVAMDYTHPDRDHTGGLWSVLGAAPSARLVTTFLGPDQAALEALLATFEPG